jgi:hypothetical protein
MEGTGTEEVAIERLDEFCGRNSIREIGFLKVDTEGYDLEVLKGATALFNQGRIGIVQLEAGMNPQNDLHVPLRDFMDFLEPRGYSLLGIYEQQNEWPTADPRLRRSNPLFIHTALIPQWT